MHKKRNKNNFLYQINMTLVLEIGALILGSIFVLTYVIDKLIEWSAYFEQKEKEEKERRDDEELSKLSRRLYS